MTGLDESYDVWRRLAPPHGPPYFMAAALLPADRRRHVWALYALARVADDIVDQRPDATPAAREAALETFRQRFFGDLDRGESTHPVLAAVVATVAELRIDRACFDAFFRSMAMDVAVTEYHTWHDLLVYMHGSAAVIGEMMLPVLAPRSPAAVQPARDLGLAFQLTNFLRDIGEDLDRGRVYVPRADLDRFGCDPSARRVDDAWRALMRFEIERARELYRSADTGVALLPPASARCVAAARTLYAQILDRIEAADYDVFTQRARVPLWRKLVTVGASVTPVARPAIRPA